VVVCFADGTDVVGDPVAVAGAYHETSISAIRPALQRLQASGEQLIAMHRFTRKQLLSSNCASSHDDVGYSTLNLDDEHSVVMFVVGIAVAMTGVRPEYCS
jgi:hypothetical protein